MTDPIPITMPTTLATPPAATPLLSVRGLRVSFPGRSTSLFRASTPTRVVDGVSFDIARGEALGLVGESGCGKTTVGRAVLRLIPASAGEVRFDGTDVLAARGPALRRLRARMQIVFQDPAGALNPRTPIGAIIAEPLRVHRLTTGGAHTRQRVRALLASCGMPDDDVPTRYPHQFSGGQRQRICIARALATRPDLLVCDEPTSALDVSIQSQILNLLKDLQRDLGLSLLFISHDMGVVRHMADRVAVMRAGRILELGDREDVIQRPRNDYTRALLAAVPVVRSSQ